MNKAITNFVTNNELGDIKKLYKANTLWVLNEVNNNRDK